VVTVVIGCAPDKNYKVPGQNTFLKGNYWGEPERAPKNGSVHGSTVRPYPKIYVANPETPTGSVVIWIDRPTVAENLRCESENPPLVV